LNLIEKILMNKQTYSISGRCIVQLWDFAQSGNGCSADVNEHNYYCNFYHPYFQRVGFLIFGLFVFHCFEVI